MLPDSAIGEAQARRQQNDIDRSRVSEESRQALADAIESVDDPDAAAALSEVAHILTGDDRFDTSK